MAAEAVQAKVLAAEAAVAAAAAVAAVAAVAVRWRCGGRGYGRRWRVVHGRSRRGRRRRRRQRWHAGRPHRQRPVRSAAPVDDRRLGATQGRDLRHDHRRADGRRRVGAGEPVPDRRQHPHPRGRWLGADAHVHAHDGLLFARLRQRSVSGAGDRRRRRRDRLRVRRQRRLPPDRRPARAEAAVRDVAREHHGTSVAQFRAGCAAVWDLAKPIRPDACAARAARRRTRAASR